MLRRYYVFMNDVIQLLAQLVEIDSINPELVPGGAGEGGIAQFIGHWLEKAGLDVHLDEVRPGRPNVIAVAQGAGGGRTLLLNGHIDTVGVAGMAQPHQPRIEHGRMYGRGAYDMKAGVAACMVAVAEAATKKLRGDVIFTAVIDEEFAGEGTLDVARRYQADAAIVAEPTEMNLVVAHKGFVWLEIETHGVAAHGSRPELGVDAIANLIKHHATAIAGRAPLVVGAPFWTDAASLSQAGIPAVLFGPSGAGAHAVEEWVDLESVQQSAAIYLAVAEAFCR